MRLKSVDLLYVLVSGIAGAWQAWCFSYAGNALLAIPMGLPFAIASYVHASVLSTTGDVPKRPTWKGILVLWAGMPLSLLCGALVILAETGIMYAAGFGLTDLPFIYPRLLIGEVAACLVWAICLLLWHRQQGIPLSRRHFLSLSAVLPAGVLAAQGLCTLALKSLHRDFSSVVVSVVATIISALMLVVLRDKGRAPQR